MTHLPGRAHPRPHAQLQAQSQLLHSCRARAPQIVQVKNPLAAVGPKSNLVSVVNMPEDIKSKLQTAYRTDLFCAPLHLQGGQLGGAGTGQQSVHSSPLACQVLLFPSAAHRPPLAPPDGGQERDTGREGAGQGRAPMLPVGLQRPEQTLLPLLLTDDLRVP